MTADDIYIPPPKRVIDHSGETSADGGGYSFVFHEKGRPKPKKEEEQKKTPQELGAPVSLNLSETVKEEMEKEALEKKKADEIPAEKGEVKNKPPDKGSGHINITV